jgi:hypothetical protein
MKLELYSIYDTIADVFNKPFAAHNDADAIRAFTQSFEQGNKANKNDYVLYSLGSYNDGNGEIKPVVPLKVFSGFDIGKEQEEEKETVKVVK